MGVSAARVVQATSHRPGPAYDVRAKYIPVNPADHVQLPRMTTPEKIALTHEQVQALAEVAGDFRAQNYLLAYAGLRCDECVALRGGVGQDSRRKAAERGWSTAAFQRAMAWLCLPK
jgi:hypothetical protein